MTRVRLSMWSEMIAHSKGVSNTFVWKKCSLKQGGFFGLNLFIQATRNMKPMQANIVAVYGALAIAIVVAIVLFYFGRDSILSLRRLTMGIYVSVGDTSDVAYSDVEEIAAFIPQIQAKMFYFPHLACDKALFHPEHVPWQGDFENLNLSSSRDCPVRVASLLGVSVLSLPFIVP